MSGTKEKLPWILSCLSFHQPVLWDLLQREKSVWALQILMQVNEKGLG